MSSDYTSATRGNVSPSPFDDRSKRNLKCPTRRFALDEKQVARRRTWAKGVENGKKPITCCDVNRVALRNDLIGDDYSSTVEMMDSENIMLCKVDEASCCTGTLHCPS